ncbi:MAG: hypothetical protein M1820_000710 [Bogoriella megaspora]|nr:MAG: hypothetical protein M1820_000710 [Bogoriella megaspora]
MPIRSRWTIVIPYTSLPTYLFGSPYDPLPDDRPVFLDAENPDKLFLTLNTYRLWSKRFAAGLQKAGLKPGERVLLFSGNTLFFPVVVQGIIMAGGIFTGANPTYVARELAYQLQDSGAKFLITAEASLDTATEAAKSIGMNESNIFLFDSGADTFNGVGWSRGNIKPWSHLIANPEAGAAFAWEELRSPSELNRTVALNYSSGTTGVPKGVEISHRNYVANCAQVLNTARLHPDYEKNTLRTRHLCFLPMYHAMAQTLFGVNAPKRGVRVFIMRKFDFKQMLECVQNYRITDLSLVPPIVVKLAKDPLVKNYDLSSIERAGCGAAPLGREVSAEFQSCFPITLRQGWGMTEATCSVTGFDPNHTPIPASVGELNANCEARIMAPDEVTDLTDSISSSGSCDRGELWIRAPNIMKGYWKKPAATAETLTPDGWLKTGDIAYVNQGKFFIVDRKKELIKVRGNQVAPAELEALLLDHPSIADAAVIGAQMKGDEFPRAYIVKQSRAQVSGEEIQEWMKGKVNRNKWLEGGVVFLDVIPKNPSGKILRKVLKEQAKSELSSERAKL